jgi:hypothetical protein
MSEGARCFLAALTGLFLGIVAIVIGFAVAQHLPHWLG